MTGLGTGPLPAAVAAGTLLLVISGCGLSSDQPAVRVDRAEVPYGLLNEPASPPPPGRDQPSTVGQPEMFFVTAQDRLVGVPLLPAASQTLPAAVAALSVGPDADSRSSGLGTAIPPGLTLAVSRLERGTATIDLRGEQGPAGEQSPLAVAQIVLTATSVPAVDRVLLTRRGQPLEAQLPDGGLTSEPLTAVQYRALVQESA